MKKAVVIFLGVLILAVMPTTSFACSCIAIPLDAHFRMTSTVFVGEVTAVTHNINRSVTPQGIMLSGPGSIEVTFKVKRAVKGEVKVDDSIVVRTSDQGSACGIETWSSQTPGTSWIVYADRRGSLLETGLCSRTKRADSTGAAEDLKYFDSLK